LYSESNAEEPDWQWLENLLSSNPYTPSSATNLGGSVADREEESVYFPGKDTGANVDAGSRDIFSMITEISASIGRSELPRLTDLLFQSLLIS
jgi:hypothetical protein